MEEEYLINTCNICHIVWNILDVLHYSVSTLVYSFDFSVISCDAPNGWEVYFQDSGSICSGFTTLILAGIICAIYKGDRFLMDLIYWIIAHIFTFKWTFLVYFIILYCIKQPFYSFIGILGFNGIINTLLFLAVGWIISYLFKRYLWDRYFITSSIHRLLDRSVLEDLYMLSLVFIPSFAVSYLVPEFGTAFVFMYAYTTSTMPGITPRMYLRTYQGMGMKMATLPRNVPFFNNWEKLEVLSNMLGKMDNPSPQQIALRDVFSKRVSPILRARKRFEEVMDYARAMPNPMITPDTPMDGVWEGIDPHRRARVGRLLEQAVLHDYVTQFS